MPLTVIKAKYYYALLVNIIISFFFNHFSKSGYFVDGPSPCVTAQTIFCCVLRQ